MSFWKWDDGRNRLTTFERSAFLLEGDMNEVKSAFASKTLWFNLAAGVLQAVDVWAGTGLIPQPWGSLITMAANFALRFVTTQPVAITGK